MAAAEAVVVAAETSRAGEHSSTPARPPRVTVNETASAVSHNVALTVCTMPQHEAFDCADLRSCVLRASRRYARASDGMYLSPREAPRCAEANGGAAALRRSISHPLSLTLE